MIIIVDEDIVQMSSLKTEFQFRGYSVEMVSNADDAWDLITKDGDIELVIIDVMLAAKPSKESRYKREATRDYSITGICLAEDILEQYLAKFSKKLVYLSHTNENGLLGLIDKSSRKNNIPFFRKRNYSSDMTLADEILHKAKLPLSKK